MTWPRSVSPDAVRVNYARIRGELGADVTVVAATKYVSLAEMAVLVEAGVELLCAAKADVNAKDALGSTALVWAAMSERDDTATASALLRALNATRKLA